MNNKSTIHIFGEVLFDHFSDGSCVLGGAPFNVAWHLQAFGLSTHFISRIGDDVSGQEIAALMDNWGMSRDDLQIDTTHPTGSVRVQIYDGEPHYDIVADSAYDFIAADKLAPTTTQGILYHGSLATRNSVARAALQAAKARHQGKIFIDVNLRAPWWHKETLLPLLYEANWVKLNEAELAELHPENTDLETTMQTFCGQFNLDTLIVTRGAKGALVWDKQQQLVTIQPPATTAVIDTVGAGDAFSALLLLGLSKQWSIETTLERAQAFASELVARRGATIADRSFYRMFSAQWEVMHK